MSTADASVPWVNGLAISLALRYSYLARNSGQQKETMKTFTEYLEQYALLSLEKKYRLERLLGEYLHELDLDSGMIRFSGGLAFPIQVLGTESDNTLTWLWAWDEEQTEIPENLVQASLQLRIWGTRENIREFTLPSVDIDQADGTAIALIATEVSRANSFFRDSYEGGAAYYLIFDASVDNQPPFDRAELLRQLTDVVARYELNHRKVLWSYLEQKGLSPIAAGDTITCELQTGERVNAEFDKTGRLLIWNGEAVTD
jgi:hypothetical protein